MSVEMAREKQINFKVTEEEAERFERVAKHHGIPVAAMLRMLAKREDDKINALELGQKDVLTTLWGAEAVSLKSLASVLGRPEEWVAKRLAELEALAAVVKHRGGYAITTKGAELIRR